MSEFSVGYSRVCITPRESVPLAGYGNTDKRMSQSVSSDLCSTCLAFTDETGESALIVTNDLILTNASWAQAVRESMAQATGVKLDHILVSATHTHSGPDMGNTKHESVQNYRRGILQWMTQAAVDAMADRKPAAFYVGTTRIEKVNFVRHYVLDDGSYCGDNFGSSIGHKYVGSTTEADRTMQILKIAREGGKDILMVNWQTHPHRGAGEDKLAITSDIVGAMRDSMEERTGCHFAYFSGAGGNINTRSRIKELNLEGNHIVCGQYMADHAIAALDSLQPLATGPIYAVTDTLTADINHTMDHLAEFGLELRREWERTGDVAACKEAGKPYGIHSPYHALAIYSKSKMGPNREIPMFAVSIGDLAFVGAPYEMFDTNGQQIKWGSPFPNTFVYSCCNDYVGYIPSAYGYEHGCYEADCTPLAAGTGERLAIGYIQMLAKLWQKQPR